MNGLMSESNQSDQIDLFAVKEKSNCEQVIDTKNGKSKIPRIFAMSIGMKEAVQLTNFDEEPYKSARQKVSINHLTVFCLRKFDGVQHCKEPQYPSMEIRRRQIEEIGFFKMPSSPKMT